MLRIGAPAYDLEAASAVIARAQAGGHPVAVTQHYHGEFGFYGRLTRPVQEVAMPQLGDWSRAHPDGYVVLTGKQSSAGCPGVVHDQPYQSGYLTIARTLVAGSDLSRLPVCAPGPRQQRR